MPPTSDRSSFDRVPEIPSARRPGGLSGDSAVRTGPGVPHVAAGLLAGLLAIAPTAQAAGDTLTLQDAIREVVQRSPQSRLIEEQATSSTQQIREIKSIAYPQVSAYADAGYGGQPTDLSLFLPGASGVSYNEADRYSYGVQVQQPLFTFGKVSTALEMASLQRKTIKATRERSRQQLELGVVDAFYGVLLSRANVGTITRSQTRLAEIGALLERNFRMGSGSRAEVAMTQASTRGLEPQRIRAERQAENAASMFNEMLGRPADAPLALDTAALLADPVGQASEDQLVTRAKSERQDLQGLALQEDLMRLKARIDQASYYPTIGAQGKFGILAYQVDDQLVSWENRDWQVGVGLTWTLFDGFAASGRKGQSLATARILSVQKGMLENQIDRDIRTARRDLAASDTALAAAHQALEAAAEAHRLYQSNYQAGRGALVELLGAEESLRGAEIGILQARYARVRAWAALRVALGQNLIDSEAR